MGIIERIKRFIFGVIICPTDKFEIYAEQVRAVMNYELDIIISTIDVDDDGYIDVSEAYEAMKGLIDILRETNKALRKAMRK